MRVRFTWFAVVLVVLAAQLCAGAPQAQAIDLPTIPILTPPPPPPKVVAPVANRLTRDPDDGVVRGTVIMIHAGGWAGHDANAQQILFSVPGDIFHARGWRIVSLDYDEGTAGLSDILSAVRDELARGTKTGPLCLYGESAGGHLALVAASRSPSIDCVIGLGAPTDLPLYEEEGPTSSNDQVRLIASRMARFFGTTPAQLAPWNPVGLAPKMRADVLLIDEGDDAYVPREHAERFKAARPTTQFVVLEPGDPADPSTKFVHGTVSEAGRGVYAATVGAFADRIVAANKAERLAARTGCARVNKTLASIKLAVVKATLGCLARKGAAAGQAFDRAWRSTSIRLHGEINAARIWALLRSTKAGRKALAAAARSRATLSVRTSEKSRVTLRARR
jgi:acetyl esterase/lipase